MASSPSPRDVRMRGFAARASVEEVRAWVDALSLRPEVEEVDLDAAGGRVLARDLVGEADVPAFDRAAMDGWALRGRDTFGATPSEPLDLAVVGVSRPAAPADRGPGPREAVRIMTGAPVPEGADAVLPAEAGREEEGRLEIWASVPPGRHVGARGEDVRAGATVLHGGRRLRPQDLGLAAATGHGRLPVLRRPRVSLLVTGDELLEPGRRPEGSRVVDANTPMLRALVERDGGVVVERRRVADREDAVGEALRAADGGVVLVSGGSSVGEEDHAPRVLAALGRLAFHGVGLRPASPTGVGLLGARPVFLLPGHPVSCLCAYDFFAGRFVRRAAGLPAPWPYAACEAPLLRKVASALGRVDYVRVRRRPGGVEPVASRGASLLSTTTEADGFLVVPAASEGFDAGHIVRVWLYDAPAPPGD